MTTGANDNEVEGSLKPTDSQSYGFRPLPCDNLNGAPRLSKSRWARQSTT